MAAIAALATQLESAPEVASMAMAAELVESVDPPEAAETPASVEAYKVSIYLL